jgi:hypothetical protein
MVRYSGWLGSAVLILFELIKFRVIRAYIVSGQGLLGSPLGALSLDLSHNRRFFFFFSVQGSSKEVLIASKMHKHALIAAVALTTAVSAECSLDMLKKATNIYLEAQSSGKPGILASLAVDTLNYTENDVPASLKTGILATPLKIDHNITLHDPTLCAVFTEAIVTDPAHPYVLGTRMVFGNSSTLITQIEAIITRPGDWLFNATGYLHWASQEDWTPIPAAKRDTRAVIQAAGDAYFDRFDKSNITMPWAPACARLEGGAYTGEYNLTANTCTLGIPPSIEIRRGPAARRATASARGLMAAADQLAAAAGATNRRYVVDVEMGSVVLFLGFPGLDGSQPTRPVPDSHMFRLENGKIRYIHTLSACFARGCGTNAVRKQGA